jgi:hypothetical protein
MIFFILVLLPLLTIILSILDDYILSHKKKQWLKDKTIYYWYQLSIFDFDKLAKIFGNKKSQYTYIYISFLIAIYFFYPPSSFNPLDLFLWFLLISSAFLIRRIIENYLVIFFIALFKPKKDNIILYRYELTKDLFKYFYFNKRKTFYETSVIFVFLIVYNILTIYFIVSIFFDIGFSKYLMEYLNLIWISELITLSTIFIYFISILILLTIVSLYLKLIEYLLLKISESNKSILYTVCIILTLLGTLFGFLNYFNFM